MRSCAWRYKQNTVSLLEMSQAVACTTYSWMRQEAAAHVKVELCKEAQPFMAKPSLPSCPVPFLLLSGFFWLVH